MASIAVEHLRMKRTGENQPLGGTLVPCLSQAEINNDFSHLTLPKLGLSAEHQHLPLELKHNEATQTDALCFLCTNFWAQVFYPHAAGARLTENVLFCVVHREPLAA